MAFSAAITNLGKYNEGILDFKWLPFPATDEEFQAALDEIGIGQPDDFGIPYEEWFVTDYDDENHFGVAQALGEYPSFDLLNAAGDLAVELEDTDFFGLEEICGEYGLEWEEYDLKAYECDDPLLDDMCKSELDNGGFIRLLFFVGQCVSRPFSDFFYLDGYDNLAPFNDYDSASKDVYKSIFRDAIEVIRSK